MWIRRNYGIWRKNDRIGTGNSQSQVHLIGDGGRRQRKPLKMQKHQDEAIIFHLFHGTFEDDTRWSPGQAENQRQDCQEDRSNHQSREAILMSPILLILC